MSKNSFFTKLLPRGVALLVLGAATSAFALSPQTITASPGSQTVYVGQWAYFGADGESTSSNYTWSGASGFGTSYNSARQTWSTPGTYYVTVQAPADTYNLASNVVTLSVTVVPLQDQTISMSPAYTSVYVGQTDSFSASGKSSGNAYAWTGANAYTGYPYDQSGATQSWSSAGTYTVSVQAPADPYYSASNTVSATVTVLPWRDQPITLTPTYTTVYVGQADSFSATGALSGGAYTWTGAVAYTGYPYDQSSASKTWTVPGTYTVTAQAPSGNYYNASNTASCTVTVLPLMTQPISMAPSVPVASVGQTVSFSATGMLSSMSYSWTGANAYTGWPYDQASATQNWSIPGTYTVTAQAGAGNHYAASNVAPAAVTVVPVGSDLLATMYGKNLATTKDPVQLATGAETLNKTLFHFSGARNWDFSISYNSTLAAAQSTAGALGYGWSHPFEASIAAVGSNLVVYPDSTHLNTYTPVTGLTGVYHSAELTAQYDKLTTVSGGGWILTHRDQSAQVFNSSGQLIEDHDAHGKKLAIAYDGSGRLSTVTESVSGTQLTFTYNSGGNISVLTDGSGASVSFSYSGAPLLTQITNQVGKHSSFTYDSSKRLLTVKNDAGVALATNTYDTGGHVSGQQDGVSGHGAMAMTYTTGSDGVITTAETDRAGAGWSYTFTPLYDLLTSTDPLGRTTTYTYDAAGNLASKSDALGHATSYAYDGNGNLTSATDPAGKVTTYTYDTGNRLLTTTDPLSHVTTRTYDTNGNLLTLTDAGGATTTWAYNTNGLPLTETLPGGGVNTFAYTSGRLTTLTDPNGVVTQWDYDADGRVAFVEDALGNKTNYVYDGAGNLLTETNALSQVITRTYDDRNRLLTKTDAAGAVTTYAYDNDSNLTGITDALGKVTTSTYDSEDRLLAVIDPLSHSTSLAYNTAGDVVSVTDGTGGVTTFQYDATGRRIGVTDPLAHQTVTAYDARDLVLSVTDPLSRSTGFTYDDVGRRTVSTNALSQQTVLAYDALGRVTGVTDPGSLATSQAFNSDGARTSFTNAVGHATTFTVDAGGRVTAVTTAGGKATGYTYNSRGLPLVSTLPSGHTTTMTYDAAQRVATIVDGVGTISITRDAVGRQLTAVENSKTLTRAYDLLGRVTQFTDGAGNVIGYAYDDAGNLRSLTYPDGKIVHYTYDDANRLKTVTDWGSRVTTYTYDAAGHLTGTARPNGTSQTRTYDAGGQLANITELGAGGTTVIYSSDATFDAVGRLTAETLSPSIPVPTSGSTTTETFDADNRLATYNGATATFDADGNLTALPGGAGGTPASYTYDARNRLTAAGGSTYAYDAEGHRVSVTDSSGTIAYVVNPNATLSQVLVRTLPGGAITRYVYGLGLIYEETGTASKFYLYTRRGDTAAITDSSGTVTDRASYGVYGEVLSRTGSTNTPFLFNGLYGVETDASGLSYHRARYYNPQLRRFINQDVTLGAIEVGAGLNRFTYANGEPVNNIDPLGLAPGDPYKSMDEAGRHAIDDINLTSIIQGREYAGLIYRNGDGTFSYTSPNAGMKDSSSPGVLSSLFVRLFKTLVADYHTHGANDPGYNNEDFSSADEDENTSDGIVGYLGTPSGSIKKYVPAHGAQFGITITLKQKSKNNCN